MSPEVIALLIGLALATALAGGGIAIGWRLRLSQVVELEGRNRELERQCGELAVALQREREAASAGTDAGERRARALDALAEGLARSDPGAGDRAAADAARLLLGGDGSGTPPDGPA